MKLLVESLPSQGHCKSKQDFITINPLTYGQCEHYASAHYMTSIENLIWDIECMIQDIQGWEDLSMYDLTALIFTRRLLTATFGPTLKLTRGSTVYEINVQDISFKDMSKELRTLDTISINGQTFKFRIPTLYEYYKILKYVASDEKNLEDWMLDVITFASCLVPMSMLTMQEPKGKKSDTTPNAPPDVLANVDVLEAYKQAIMYVETSVHEDITVIKTIQVMLKDQFNDVTIHGEGGDTAISLYGLTADIFRLIWINAGDVSHKITFKTDI